MRRRSRSLSCPKPATPKPEAPKPDAALPKPAAVPKPQPDPTPDPVSIDGYTQIAFANRFDLRQQQENIYAQGYNVRIARINNGVQVNASAFPHLCGARLSNVHDLQPDGDFLLLKS